MTPLVPLAFLSPLSTNLVADASASLPAGSSIGSGIFGGISDFLFGLSGQSLPGAPPSPTGTAGGVQSSLDVNFGDWIIRGLLILVGLAVVIVGLVFVMKQVPNLRSAVA